MSETHLVDQGFRDEERSLVVGGFLASVGTPDRESYHGEHFHRLPFNRRGIETLRIRENDLSAGEDRLIKVRGAGQFGVFRRASSDETGLTIKVYSDNNRTQLICEIEV